MVTEEERAGSVSAPQWFSPPHLSSCLTKTAVELPIIGVGLVRSTPTPWSEKGPCTSEREPRVVDSGDGMGRPGRVSQLEKDHSGRR